MTKNNVWKVEYSFVAYHIDGRNPEKRRYFVIAPREEDAFDKANELFASNFYGAKKLLKEGFYTEPGVEFNDLLITANIYSKKVTTPKLSKEDSKNFSLEAKVNDDGKTIDFIVKSKN